MMVNSAWDHFTKPRPSTEGMPIQAMQRCLEAASYYFGLEGRWTLFTGETALVMDGEHADVVMSAWLHCTGNDEPKDAMSYSYQLTDKQIWDIRRMNRQQARNHTPVSVD